MVIDYQDSQMPKVLPIDFTFCQRIGDKIEVKEGNGGNMMFGSLDYMLDKPVSQRDDLISLCYLLIYSFNLSNLPLIEEHFTENGEIEISELSLED